MKVKLIAYTKDADLVCGIGALNCISKNIPTVKDNPEAIVKSVRMALKSGHESVLEHATYTFSIEGISRVCSHQLVRHRMASYSQQSQRYVRCDSDCMIPDSIYKMILDDMYLYKEYKGYFDALNSLTGSLRKKKVPEEDIRYLYPQGTTTNIIVTMNARELRHFFNLRCCNRAQWEIRDLANEMLRLCKEASPIIFDNSGASCVTLGYCPEAKGCGKK